MLIPTKFPLSPNIFQETLPYPPLKGGGKTLPCPLLKGGYAQPQCRDACKRKSCSALSLLS